jgi:hypothetical protein
MTVLIDQPVWPAHDTVWSHLVSDSSLDELHVFAAANGIPRRGFDLDHYDVPQHRYDALVAAGAVPVSNRELVTRLLASGLRVTGRQRAGRQPRACPGAELVPEVELVPDARSPDARSPDAAVSPASPVPAS